MKVVHSLAFLLLMTFNVVKSSSSSKTQTVDPTKCNKTLMDSYDIEGIWDPTLDRNLICPMANKHNCCNYHAQLDIYKKWVMQGEGRKIRDLYKTYAQAIGKIPLFSNFQKLFSTDSLKLRT